MKTRDSIGPKPELLAPAGGLDAGFAALENGADAVYTGLKRFSARAEAENLEPRELEELCAWAHAKGRRVYVTLNTLVRGGETGGEDGAAAALETCAACGADAAIVQDLGVARMAKKCFPGLRLHASTQLAVHNAEGAREAAALGFARVTLARELTLAEIRAVAEGAGCEVEAFAHGALCYSYSGLCLYSALLRGRSGNRGACAYPCREAFCEEGDDGKREEVGGALCFSMMDLAADGFLGDLAAAGVASLKIEGRKKSPLYVAAAVRYYRGLLDGTLRGKEAKEAARDLKTVFSRPWTPLHLASRRGGAVIDPAATGHRGTYLGRVEAAGRRFVQFRPNRPLEVHDGLQVELEGETRPFGFAVESITLSDGRETFAAPAGALLEVPLPPQAPPLAEGTALYLASSQALKRRFRVERPNPREWRRRLPVRVAARRTGDGGCEVEARAADGAEEWRAVRGVPGPLEAPRDAKAMREALHGAFAKLGETPFELAGFKMEGDVPFLPVSRLNALRRELADDLEGQWLAARRARAEAAAAVAAEGPTAAGEASGEAERRLMVKTDQPDALRGALDGIDGLRIGEVTVELVPGAGFEAIERLEDALGAKVRLALPAVVRAWDREGLAELVRHGLESGRDRWEVANLGGLGLLREAAGEAGIAGLDLSADWPLYVWNPAAAAELAATGIRRWTCSPEDSMDNIRALADAMPWRMVWIVHRDPPLFLSENCPHAAKSGGCPGPSRCGYEGETLSNRLGETVRVVNRNCRFATLAAEPSVHPVPPGWPVLARADFLWRPWTAETLRHALFHVI